MYTVTGGTSRIYIISNISRTTLKSVQEVHYVASTLTLRSTADKERSR